MARLLYEIVLSVAYILTKHIKALAIVVLVHSMCLAVWRCVFRWRDDGALFPLSHHYSPRRDSHSTDESFHSIFNCQLALREFGTSTCSVRAWCVVFVFTAFLACPPRFSYVNGVSVCSSHNTFGLFACVQFPLYTRSAQLSRSSSRISWRREYRKYSRTIIIARQTRRSNQQDQVAVCGRFAVPFRHSDSRTHRTSTRFPLARFISLPQHTTNIKNKAHKQHLLQHFTTQHPKYSSKRFDI